MKLNVNTEQLRVSESLSVLEPLRLDEEKDQKPVFWKVRVWKNVLRGSRKILSAAMAAIFLSQLTLANTVRAELPPPTAAELTNPQIPTVSVDSTTTTTTPSTTTTPAPVAPVSTDAFLTEGPLSAPMAAAQAPGRSLYVSTTGNDTADGSTANPYGTIAYAVSQLQAGDTLYINAGTYYQSGGGAVFTTSGTTDSHITVQGLGNVIIEGTGTTMIGGYPVASNYNPAFDTGGQDYIDFKNLTVNNLRAPVKASTGSSYIDIDGVNADRDHFGVWVDGSDHVSVHNMTITNCRNGVRTDSTAGVIPTNILFEDMDVSGSKDVYSGFETRYRNGDGFILEFGNNIIVRNVVSRDNWDSGFDIKATNVTLENVDCVGNYHQGVKIWGTGIVVKNSMIRDTRSLPGDPVASEGFGLNNRGGSVTFINTTFANNYAADIRTDNQIGNPTTILQNCIIARNISSGKLWEATYGGITDSNNIWFDATKSADFTLSGSSRFLDPKFVDWAGKDLHLQSTSPAVNFGSTSYPIGTTDYDGQTRVVGSTVDVGAFEYQGLSTPDTTAPVISVVTSTNVAANGATINWTTNEASDSQVQYRVQGTTVWSSTALNASLVTNHSVVLNGLNTSTVYEYQVKSKDQAGNLATQATISNFTTLAPDTTAPVISAVVSSNVTSTGATINWTTNEASDSQVEYRVQGATDWLATSINATPVTNHSVVLSGLSPSTVYQYRVKSKDQAGNLATQATISSLTTAAPAPTGEFSGVTAGATVSGVVNIGPNLTLYPTIRKASYYLNGTQSGKVYASPYLWGGPAGDGTTGFDTRTLADGNYTLNMGYTDSTGDHGASVSFTVLNTAPPTDTTSPVISVVSSADVTPTGATINWTTDEASDSQVQYRVQGTTAWLTTALNASLVTSHSVVLSGLNASTVYEYQVKSKDQAGNLATQATISNLTTADLPPSFVGVQDGATVSGTVSVGPNLQTHSDLSRVVYSLNGTSSGDVSQSPFYWGGASSNGSTGFDTTVLANGDYTLSALCYEPDGTHEMSIGFTVQNIVQDTTAPVISAVASGNITTSGATINWTTDEASDSQVQYRVQGTTAWLTTALNASLVTSHSAVLSGLNASTAYEYQVKSKDQAGNLATQATISSLTTATPPVTGDFVGVTSGATVSGIVNIGPNLTLHPSVRKASYYLNGTKSGKVYTSPYLWGGPTGDGTTGFDTRTLADGNYTLNMGYTDSTGDHSASVSFVVSNTTIPSDTTVPVISAVTASGVTASGATINWTTDEVSDSQVQYRVQGTTTWLSTTLNTSLVTNHSVVLSGLNASTVYEYQVLSKDQAGNRATQATISNLTTLALADTTAPVISAVAATNVTSAGATISWTTNELSDSQVEYRVQGTTTWSTVGITDPLATDHVVVLNGLTAGTVYEYRVMSKDQAGNLATQATISNFTTQVQASTGDFVGVTDGATVSGIVNIGPNLTLYPSIRKVAYYLNGTQSGKYYSAPFMWGGTSGFDTRALENGTYTLTMGYTDSTGDHGVEVTVTVQN